MKGLPGINALAYFAILLVMKNKGFLTLTVEVNILNHTFLHQ
jgi:hypothetical protein